MNEVFLTGIIIGEISFKFIIKSKICQWQDLQ